MSKHSLGLYEQIAGLKVALASKRTPRRLRPALRRRLQRLEQEFGKHSRPILRSPKFLGWFEF